jgi:hypothetical protein
VAPPGRLTRACKRPAVVLADLLAAPLLAGPLPFCNWPEIRQGPAKLVSLALWTNHLASAQRGSLASGLFRFSGACRRGACVGARGRKRLETLCRSKPTGHLIRFDVERSWTGLFEGALKRTAPKSPRRAVQDCRAPSCRSTGQNSPRWAHPSRSRRASLSNCFEGEPMARVPRRGAPTLEGVPDEDALSSKSSSRVGVATTPLVRKEARSRMAFSAPLATQTCTPSK